MSVESKIQNAIAQCLLEKFNITVEPSTLKLIETRKEFKGAHTFTTFPYIAASKLSVEQLGETIGNFVVAHCQEVSAFNVVKGFLNLELATKTWANYIEKVLNEPEFGRGKDKNQKVMVEYSSPNTNKPLHLGHLRNNFLGFALSNILEFSGYSIVKANLVNDRGIHICKSMLAYQKFGKGETPSSSGQKGDHLVGHYYVVFDQKLKEKASELKSQGWSDEDVEKKNPLLLEAQEMLRKWEAGEPNTVNLWKQMNEWVYAGFHETYQKIGVKFDRFYYESDTYLLGKTLVSEGLEKGIFYQKTDGSVWIDLTEEGLDHKLVLRGDGTSVYITQDMGTADLKYKDYACEKSVYVVGNEQDYHFVVLKHILKKLQIPYAEGVYHLSYGMVDLPSGKMKSREGTVVDADDLVQEMVETAEQTTKELGKIDGFESAEAQHLYQVLALGALKYFLLKVDPKKRMLFNPQESIEFQGNTGPFIQYTHARISAILRKALQMGIEIQDYQVPASIQMETQEIELIRTLYAFPEKVEEAAQAFAPSIIAQYAYDVAKTYNRFYTDLSIFGESNAHTIHFRIALSFASAQVIKRALALLGIEAPERM